MFSLKKWFLALLVVFFSGAAIAELSPDEVVKKTADDVISAIKSDKDIQAGNKKAIYALVESKILPSFDFAFIIQLTQKYFILQFLQLLFSRLLPSSGEARG